MYFRAQQKMFTFFGTAFTIMNMCESTKHVLFLLFVLATYIYHL
jgi:hypothetical protein